MNLIQKYDTTTGQNKLGKIQENELGFEIVNDKTFNFYQAEPMATWTIEHTLDKFTSVKATDLSFKEIKGKITYISNAEIKIEFNTAKSGYAFLN